ncbi:SDR family NAD(P)-dependent oxidoreductase [Paenarthrobacter sp. NPDC090522]|uniref:SDR family NAD(P)-dependent oxidoreductase n=1 Tax=Paenarthrobacter sp. NPDC090522 TaxID=3364383 RepID=UPI0037F624AB
MTTRANERTALVTGATAGLGAEFARQLAEGGHHLVLVARDEGRLKAKAGELERDFSVSVETLAADLTTAVGVSAVADRLRDAARPVDVLVNNAGIGLLKSFEDNELEEERRHLHLHVQTPMELCHAALEVMLVRGSGRIINVASVAAFANRGTYSAAKAWQVTFSRWANLAYAKSGVQVTAVCPGFTHTEFHERMGMDKSVAPRFLWLTAERVVREGLEDNAQGKAISIPTRRYKVVSFFARVLPAKLTSGPPRRPLKP